MNYTGGLNTQLIHIELIHDVIGGLDAEGAKKWRVMVVDARSLRILSACCRMYDIMEENITG